MKSHLTKSNLGNQSVKEARSFPLSGSRASWRIICKECRRCNQVKLISEFDKNHPSKDGHINICKTCKSKYNKEYNQTEQSKASHKRYRQSEKSKERYKRYSVRHPNHIKAKNAVNHAIRAGQLPRPDTLFCKYCYGIAEQYHHHKGYAPKYWLDVVPVCEKCHRKIHTVPAPTAVLF